MVKDNKKQKKQEKKEQVETKEVKETAPKTEKKTKSQGADPVKFLKPGKVVILLQGRFAGRKAVIVRTYDEGTKTRPYPHAIVAGVDKYPKRVNPTMSAKTIAKRSRITTFLKAVNYDHVMPTRYGLDIDVKGFVNQQVLEDPTKRLSAKKKIKQLFQKRYLSGKNRWFFTKLKF